MDNVTHSLVGAAVGECALQLGEPPERASAARRGYWLVSILANNLPDVDVLYAHALGGKLGYLLHHRGHTHTFALALPLSLTLIALLSWLWRGRPRSPTKASERIVGSPGALLALALLGPFVHIGMDAWNLYGVHPLWPLHSGWYFGDSVFVLEPWIWTILIPSLAATPGLSGRWQAVLWTLFLLVLMLAAATGRVPALSLAGLVLAAVTASRVAPYLGAGRAFVALLAVGLGVASARTISGDVKRAVQQQLPRPAHDIIVSPFPARPTCWGVTTVETDSSRDLYRLRRGVWAATSLGTDPADCLAAVPKNSTAPMRPPDIEDVGPLAWRGQFEAPLSELGPLSRARPRFRALLRFARAPFWLQEDSGAWVFGDFRFDRSEALGFSELRDPPGPPPASEAPDVPWIPPRADLLAKDLP